MHLSYVIYFSIYVYVSRPVADDMLMVLETLTEINNIITRQEVEALLSGEIIPSLADVQHAVYNRVNDYIGDNLY